MSANNADEIVSQCLEMGATDYLVKPVRVQECRAFSAKMKVRPLATGEITGIQKYDLIRRIG